MAHGRLAQHQLARLARPRQALMQRGHAHTGVHRQIFLSLATIRSISDGPRTRPQLASGDGGITEQQASFDVTRAGRGTNTMHQPA